MRTESAEFQLTERAALVLQRLVGRYIRDGNPVGSHTLARETELAFSPATIRNVMAELEAHGLIAAPHTSAGRIPTQRGYRLFIDALLRVGAQDAEVMNKRARNKIEKRIRRTTDPKSILSGAAEMLSQVTSFAGIVSIADKSRARIRQIEFLRLSQQRVLVILVTKDGRVQNRIVSVEREYSAAELVEAANYFNASYSARTLQDVRTELAARMRQERRSMHREMRLAISMARHLFDEQDGAGGNVLVRGENNLLAIADFGELEKLKKLFDTFKTKQVLFDLLQKSLLADGVNIFVGEESGYRMFRDCSVIAAPYEVDHQKVGVLGVIGPTRMNYDEVIATVKVTAKLLGNALSVTSAKSIPAADSPRAPRRA